jgi:hypothetical protein
MPTWLPDRPVPFPFNESPADSYGNPKTDQVSQVLSRRNTVSPEYPVWCRIDGRNMPSKTE